MKYNEIYSLPSDISCAFTFPHFIWTFLLCPHCLHPASCGFYFHSVSWVWGLAQGLVLKMHRDKKTQLHRTHCGPLDPGNSKPSFTFGCCSQTCLPLSRESLLTIWGSSCSQVHLTDTLLLPSVQMLIPHRSCSYWSFVSTYLYYRVCGDNVRLAL